VLVIRESDEGIPLLFPHLLETAGALRPDDQDHGVSDFEFVIILAQLREMGTAIRSDKAAREHEYDVLFALIVGQVNLATGNVGQREIRGRLSLGQVFGHYFPSFSLLFTLSSVDDR